MLRILHGLAAGAVTAALLATPALAKDSAAPTAEPVSVTLENTCKAALKVEFGRTLPVEKGAEPKRTVMLTTTVEPGATSAPQTLPGQVKRSEQAYELNLLGKKPTDLGLLGMKPGGTYHVKFANCIAGGADIFTTDKTPRPETVSPQAAAQVRFRLFNRGRAVEYKAGKKGRFKKLAQGYTSYEEQPGGQFDFMIRLRGKARGPVMGMRRAKVTLEPGHNYLVETSIVGREIRYKFEDEGWNVPEAK